MKHPARDQNSEERFKFSWRSRNNVTDDLRIGFRYVPFTYVTLYGLPTQSDAKVERGRDEPHGEFGFACHIARYCVVNTGTALVYVKVVLEQYRIR